MSTTVAFDENLIVDFGSLVPKVSDKEFAKFCRLNPEVRVERTSKGDLVIMPPTGGKTGIQNFELTGEFHAWVRKDGTGKGFDSSTVFSLPNGASRSPDLSWVRNERWQALTVKEQEGFPPLCPDFVLELRSPSDSLPKLKEKMEEYMANGATLGWLLDPLDRRIYIYQPNLPVRMLDNPLSLSGEPSLKGFVLELRSIWG
jgi:Uma2 family endonuclease